MNDGRPPWNLGGFCMMIFYLVSSRKAADFVPSPLEVSEVVPGATLGGLYAASYRSGDFGTLSEFSAFPALVRYKKKRGFFIPFSMVGSRESSWSHKGAWGLRKERAVFDWEQHDSRYVLKVHCNDQAIVTLGLHMRRISFPIRVSFPFFHVRAHGVISYHADYAAKVHLSASTVEIPQESPIAAYGLRRKLLTTLWESTKIRLHAPQSEKNIVITEGVSEGIFHVSRKPLDTCSVQHAVGVPQITLTRHQENAEPIRM
jgi:hypothetical protein